MYSRPAIVVLTPFFYGEEILPQSFIGSATSHFKMFYQLIARLSPSPYIKPQNRIKQANRNMICLTAQTSAQTWIKFQDALAKPLQNNK
jgi:hypothetical protein